MIYLDHAATSPLRPAAWQAMQEVVGEADFNPASAHSAGGRAADVLEAARSVLADSLGVARSRLAFTGGGTPSDNLAILGFARAHGGAVRLLVSAVEHKAVLEAAARAEEEGAEVHVIPVDETGTVRVDAMEARLASDSAAPTLVSVMWANNEVGVVQPIRELCDVAHRHGARFHTDAVQAFGKLPVSLSEIRADLLTVTAHKIGGPVGIGLLVCTDDVDLEPLVYGGSQEGGLWPGTQNPIGAAGFAEAARLAVAELPESAARWASMRDRLEARIRATTPEAVLHAGTAAERLPHLLSAGLPGIDQAVLLTALDLEGIAASAGSACSSGAQTGSHVLQAMGVAPDTPYAVLRLSLGPSTTDAEVDRASDILDRVLERVGRLAV